jgi:F0F1-type ATP synthase assembly protein I
MKKDQFPHELPKEQPNAPAAGQDNKGSYSAQLKKNKHHLRGVQTMFKNSSSNHQRLSVLADNKALIMISVNSIIVSVAIGLLIGKFAQNSNLIYPTLLLLSVSVVTIIYSVLATRPSIQKGTFTREQVDNKTVNLLFFGSFYKMELSEFEYGIRQMIDDSEFLYGTLIKDIYWQGKVLGRKFRLLRISYDVFMYGIAVSVIAFLVTAFV